MRVCILIFCVAGILGNALAEPEDLNCDFETGMDKWRGDGRVETDESGNKVCVLKKRGDRTREITHKIKVPESQDFEVHFRVRAMPVSEKVILRRSVRNPKGASFSSKELMADGKWVQQQFDARGTEGERISHRIIALVFHEGEGEIQIDDIKVVVKP